MAFLLKWIYRVTWRIIILTAICFCKRTIKYHSSKKFVGRTRSHFWSLKALVRFILATAIVRKIDICVVHPDRMVFTMVLIGASKLQRWQTCLELKGYGLPSTGEPVAWGFWFKKSKLHRFLGWLVIDEKWRASYGGGGLLMIILSLDAVSLLARWGACNSSQSERECIFVIIM